MESILGIITAISLVLAVAMGVIVFRLLREERQRSDARVAALAAAAAVDDPPLRLREPAAAAAAPRLRHDSPSSELFAQPSAESPWLRRIAVAAAVAAAVTVAGYGLTRLGAPAPPAAAQRAPLELLALRHTVDADGLTISGTVQNPRTGAPVGQIEATVLLFDAAGAVLATARGSVDYATLAPGDESPFVLRVPVKAAVSRYRVGFRGPDGHVLAHVDRRAELGSRQTARTEKTPWAQ